MGAKPRLANVELAKSDVRPTALRQHFASLEGRAVVVNAMHVPATPKLLRHVDCISARPATHVDCYAASRQRVEILQDGRQE
eukprot:6524137-Prymnesium_polylepis.2